jgi:hypothetical protein
MAKEAAKLSVESNPSLGFNPLTWLMGILAAILVVLTAGWIRDVNSELRRLDRMAAKLDTILEKLK